MREHKIAVTLRVNSQQHVSTIYASVPKRSPHHTLPVANIVSHAEFQALRHRVDSAVQEFVNAWIEGQTFLPD